MESMEAENIQVVQFDDVIEFNGTKERRKINESRAWRKHFSKLDLSGYYLIDKRNENESKGIKKYISIKEYEAITEYLQSLYGEFFSWFRVLGKGVKAIVDRNEVIIRLSKLSNDFESRCRKALEALDKIKLFKYTPWKSRTRMTMEKQKKKQYEALRLRFKRNFKIKKYEWNIAFIDAKLGKIFYESARKNEKYKIVENTIYFQGMDITKESRKKTRLQSKIYNVSALQRGDSEYNYIEGDIIKIELTYLKTQWKNINTKINEMKTPIDIHKIINEIIVKDFKKIYTKLSESERKEVKMRMKVKNEMELFKAVTEKKTVWQAVSELQRDVKGIKTKQANTDARLENTDARLENIEKIIDKTRIRK